MRNLLLGSDNKILRLHSYEVAPGFEPCLFWLQRALCFSYPLATAERKRGLGHRQTEVCAPGGAATSSNKFYGT